MRTLLLTLLLVPMMSVGQNVYIPDANFKNYLVNNASINTNGDSEIQVSEASAFTGEIYCYGLSISDLTGIEAFSILDTLYCGGNELTSLDVSNNSALTKLNCNYNQLTSLDVSSNTDLTQLNCEGNNLTSLDVSNNTALITLSCSGNQLECLNVKNGNNTDFITLQVDENPNLTCIEVDDINYSTVNWTLIDNQISFSTDCNNDCSGNTIVLPCPPSNQCEYVFTMTDTEVDGWDGASVNFVQGGQIVSTQELGLGLGSISLNIMLCDNMATEIIVNNAGVYPEEVGYTLIDSYGNTVASLSSGGLFSSGDILSTFTTSCNSSVAGCTDPTACNYVDAATVDDLSCIYASASIITAEELDSYTAPSGTIYTTGGVYTDTIQNAAGCDSIITIDLSLNFTGIGELNNTPKQLIKIVDVLGRETPFKPNTPLLYIYNDGTVERKMIIK